MRKVGGLIVWDLAQRKGDFIELGRDLIGHICNLLGLGEKERKRFARRERRGEAVGLWMQQLCLLDEFSVLIFQNAAEISVKLTPEGWQRLATLSKDLESLNRRMNK